MLIPDVAAPDEVVCPCGQYRITAALLADCQWLEGAALQVVSPCCDVVMEVWPT